MHNTKEDWWVFLVRTLCRIMDQIQPKTRIPLAIYFSLSLFLLILCLPNVSTNLIMIKDKISYLYNINEDWWVLLWIMLCQIMDQLRPKTGNPLEIYFGVSLFYLYDVFIMLKKILSWHRSILTVWTTQSKTCECCLKESCVISWISYILKRGITWQFILVSLFFY